MNELVCFTTTDYYTFSLKVSLSMRPNIDISHTLGGRVKDYAEANDMELSDAYAEVLEAGLEALETQNGE